MVPSIFLSHSFFVRLSFAIDITRVGRLLLLLLLIIIITVVIFIVVIVIVVIVLVFIVNEFIWFRVRVTWEMLDDLFVLEVFLVDVERGAVGQLEGDQRPQRALRVHHVAKVERCELLCAHQGAGFHLHFVASPLVLEEADVRGREPVQHRGREQAEEAHRHHGAHPAGDLRAALQINHHRQTRECSDQTRYAENLDPLQRFPKWRLVDVDV
mmetsp:Transcript_8545/g.21189  ORF Transcript_8545/g.21189 Transcript_8545/m.21189 type:complete len:212 (-) Transcript_8545:367-1002(-)